MKIYPLDSAIHLLNNWGLNDTAFSPATLPTQAGGGGVLSLNFEYMTAAQGLKFWSCLRMRQVKIDTLFLGLNPKNDTLFKAGKNTKKLLLQH